MSHDGDVLRPGRQLYLQPGWLVIDRRAVCHLLVRLPPKAVPAHREHNRLVLGQTVPVAPLRKTVVFPLNSSGSRVLMPAPRRRLPRELFETRTHSWHEAGLGHELETRSPGRALGRLLVALLTIAATL